MPSVRPGRGVLIDIGGVLVPPYWHLAATEWAPRCDLDPEGFLAALYAGSDETVLIGRVDEADWWREVGRRLRLDAAAVAELRAALADHELWDLELLGHLATIRSRARTAIVSNAWASTRERMAAAGHLGIADAIILSCEVGVAKPDPEIFEIALAAIDCAPDAALFVDDTEENVEAARAVGMEGHLHLDRRGTIEAIDGFLARTPA